MTDPAPLHISMAVDKGFELPLLVALSSLARAHQPAEATVTVLHTGVAEATRARFTQEVSGRLEVSWVEVNLALLADAHFPAFLSPATLFRLLLPTYLPAGLDRTLYLDADTVTVGSFGALWHTDLGDDLAAAVRDCNTPWAAGPLGTDWRALGLAASAPYLNAGLLLIPLARWRSEQVAEQAVELLRKGKPRWGDQDALNVVLQGRWRELPRRWNLQTGDASGNGFAWALWPDDVQAALDDPAMLHFTERDKPWNAGSLHPLREKWFAELDRTHRAGWRPGPGGRPLYRRLGGRVRRAARELLTDS